MMVKQTVFVEEWYEPTVEEILVDTANSLSSNYGNTEFTGLE
jgi:hypothetical protein